jgi:hypothetical protein
MYLKQKHLSARLKEFNCTKQGAIKHKVILRNVAAILIQIRKCVKQLKPCLCMYFLYLCD